MKSLWGALSIFVAIPLIAAETPASPQGLITRAIAALGDETYAVRSQARADLRKIGLPALAQLREAAKSDSPETRISARELFHVIGRDILTAEFERFGKLPDAKMDVEEGMWLAARILDPELTRKSIAERLDGMAAAVRAELGEGVEPAKAPPARVVAAVREVLGKQFGLQGDRVTYNHPDNSSVHRVLERKKGLPILLSEIAVAVGRRLDVPLVGLAIPGRYMVKYDGKRAPEGHARVDIIINPFEGWRLMTVEELEQAIVGFDRHNDLEPAAPRGTLMRMLNNMYAHAIARRQPRLAEGIRSYQLLLGAQGGFLRPFELR